MNVDINLFQLIILIIPGFVCRTIISSLCSNEFEKKNSSEFREFINAIIYSVIIILFAQLIASVIAFIFKIQIKSIVDQIASSGFAFEWWQYLILAVTTITIALVATVFIENRVFYGIMNFLKLTRNYSNENAWLNFIKSPNGQWIFIRDLQNDLLYSGYVEKYEIETDEKYVILSNVKVYKASNDQELYAVESMLIKCNVDSIIIEKKG